MLPLLNGCAPAILAVQAVPAVIGAASIANAENRDPFGPRIPTPPPSDEDEDNFTKLSRYLQRAECGDPEAQYWVAASLNDEFNASPNKAEIYKWYYLAKAGGVAPAILEIDALDSSLPRTDIVEGRRRAREWRPVTEGCVTES